MPKLKSFFRNECRIILGRLSKATIESLLSVERKERAIRIKKPNPNILGLLHSFSKN